MSASGALIFFLSPTFLSAVLEKSFGVNPTEYGSVDEDKASQNVQAENVDRPGPWGFHVIMCLSGLYMSMVLSNWVCLSPPSILLLFELLVVNVY
jgi:hypothetical protein